MLPPSNVLYCTNQDLHSIMTYIEMENQSIHACPNDHILYYAEHASKKECPKCQISKYRTDLVTKNVSCKVLFYIPIIPCM